ncbi:hypothetical protein AVEN_75722-1 [Araneus ventricosus]|uniref:Uncharacterized protein n=1 Tax=Araneus ventricosus TaxID=182803 RepID=A0A4Y2JXR4_ARAVE|nr:hypothetical protein AVEN_75722-1 [Araneus ventricosus]
MKQSREKPAPALTLATPKVIRSDKAFPKFIPKPTSSREELLIDGLKSRCSSNKQETEYLPPNKRGIVK